MAIRAATSAGQEELAERTPAPAVRAALDTLVLADGLSYRLQIAQTTGRRALHPAELLDVNLPRRTAGRTPSGRSFSPADDGSHR